MAKFPHGLATACLKSLFCALENPANLAIVAVGRPNGGQQVGQNPLLVALGNAMGCPGARTTVDVSASGSCSISVCFSMMGLVFS